MNIKFKTPLLVLSLLTSLSLAQWSVAALVLAPELESIREQAKQSPSSAIDAVLAKLNADPTLSGAARAQHYFVLAEVYKSQFLANKTYETASQAAGLAFSTGDELLGYWSTALQADAMGLQGDTGLGLSYIEPTIGWAKSNDKIGLQIFAMDISSWLHLKSGDHLLALELIQGAYQLAVEHPEASYHPPQRIAQSIGIIYQLRDEYRTAEPYFLETLAFAKRTGDKLLEADALYNLGSVYRGLKDQGRAIDYYQQSLAISRAADDAQGAAYTISRLVDMTLENTVTPAQMVEIEDQVEWLLQAFSDAKDFQEYGRALQLQAKLYWANGEQQEALTIIDTAQSLAREAGIEDSLIEAMVIKTDFLGQLNEYELAYQELQALRELERKYHQAATDARYQSLRAQLDIERQKLENELLVNENTNQQNALELARSQRTILGLIAAVFLVIIIAAGVIFSTLLKQRKILQRLAQADALTGLPNRRHTFELCSRELKLAQREDRNLCIAVADIDNFKSINDAFGHKAGDEALKFFANLARRHFRETDILGRIGGEEFIIVILNSSPEDAKKQLEYLMEKLLFLPESLKKYNGLKLTFSSGLIRAAPEKSVQDNIAEADKLLYIAKKSGKNQVHAA
jgi:diguanylate cyclase (GGDEF)-like protein